AACTAVAGRALAEDVSAPPILQYFESTHTTIENRAADIFTAGYGSVWTPPPGRADSGDSSVGYDVYDRFDLGSPGKPTLYGTETGLKTAASALHQFGGAIYTDLILNHAGFNNVGNGSFVSAGGYPGLAIARPDDIDGDFHSAYATGDTQIRI